MMGLLPCRSFQAQQQTLLLKLPHMGLSNLWIGCNTSRRPSWTTQVGTPITCRYLYLSLTISCRISSSGSKPTSWSCLTSIHVVFDGEFSTLPFMREVIIPQNCTDIMQWISQSSAPDNISLKDTKFQKRPIWYKLVLGYLPVWLINLKKYALFAKFSLAVVRSFEVDKKPDIYLTRANQHIQENNRRFGGTLNNFYPMIFEAKQ